ncbi:isocitrate/isopropylmalate dehydrogenase family protein [Jiella avicenniae]|uniref:Isocitrate/isopropylmalate dehydrogenase family protein n=1 Tax=Jiella avicenniae TaxID=2907202 RepID=A0A9X1TCX3_9HYPH|nr:isocitrate/isopropylmalate family dehydrogenase [Jiella avicenniae]MCE7029458.1 isocitrate/isopropylmalate dehydrogenase family protein [Jiella avicenniae]
MEFNIATIKGDGIGVDVTDAAMAVIGAAQRRVGGFSILFHEVDAGAAYYRETGRDISPEAERAARELDAILLGAIGLPTVRHEDGTEITPHLRLREEFQLYAGVRPVKAYANTPQRLADPRARSIDFIVLRECTEGLFYSAATHKRKGIANDDEVQDILRITRPTTEKLHDFAFHLARKRKERGGKGRVTCVDKSNVFRSMAFFRKIFDERAVAFPDIRADHNYIDAQALDLVRKPWEFDVMVMENMFGDILSDLGGGLVGGMGIASCAEIGDAHGLFQPAHGSAPDIMGEDKANPLAAILSGALMLDYLADRSGNETLVAAAELINDTVAAAFEANRIRPMEYGGEMGTKAVTRELIAMIETP